MKRRVAAAIAALVLVALPRTVMAQAKTVTSQLRTETATVESTEASTRTVTLKKTDGTYVTTVAGPDITRFDEIKVGDKVTARYYENLVIRLKKPGESEVDSKVSATTGSAQELPGGTRAQQRTITATITAIDMETPTISFTGPNGWKYTAPVQDKPALSNVKVGDKVDIVWTEALLVALER